MPAIDFLPIFPKGTANKPLTRPKNKTLIPHVKAKGESPTSNSASRATNTRFSPSHSHPYIFIDNQVSDARFHHRPLYRLLSRSSLLSALFSKCPKASRLHALIAWPEIEFTACHKPIHFSTDPQSKQRLLYLREVLTFLYIYKYRSPEQALFLLAGGGGRPAGGKVQVPRDWEHQRKAIAQSDLDKASC